MGETDRREFLRAGVAVATVAASGAAAALSGASVVTAAVSVESGTREAVGGGSREAAGVAAVGPVAARRGEGMGDQGAGLQVGNRVHVYVRPSFKERFSWCFSTVLGCGAPMSLNAAGIAEPILAWRFPGGGSLSVEFTEEALDEAQARRGAWLEFWAADPEALKAAILAAGLPQVHYSATNTFYFAAPGGQVFGVVSARQPSAGELRTKP